MWGCGFWPLGVIVGCWEKLWKVVYFHVEFFGEIGGKTGIGLSTLKLICIMQSPRPTPTTTVKPQLPKGKFLFYPVKRVTLYRDVYKVNDQTFKRMLNAIGIEHSFTLSPKDLKNIIDNYDLPEGWSVSW